MNQIELHNKIDTLIQSGHQATTVATVLEIIKTNSDARLYFYTKADELWLDWLWQNNFLDPVKAKVVETDRYSYSTPELGYLVRMVEKKPKEVTDIILQVSISKEHFNPEVVDRFLWIARSLPADQTARIANKIRDEQWPKLMWRFNRWGFEYEQMFKKLSEAKDYDSLLAIAEAVLAVKTKEDETEGVKRMSLDSPFYLDHLAETKVFQYFVSVDDLHVEQALALATEVMGNAFNRGEKANSDEIFPIRDTFYLSHVDFFTLELEEGRHISYREDVRDLAAVAKLLITKAVEIKKGDGKAISNLYEKYIKTLPDSQTMWRFRMYVLSLAPEMFKDELKSAFFRIFREDDKPWALIYAEYERAVYAGFATLEESEKRDYVSRVLSYFGDRMGEDADLWKHHGWQILSGIVDQLTDEEKKQAEQKFGKTLDDKYEPEPAVKYDGFARTIVSQPPVTAEELAGMPILDIVAKLKDDWSPQALAEKYKDEPFHRPIDADGVGQLIKSDMANRLQEYLNDAPLFFDRESLDSDYTYAFLRGIEQILRDKKNTSQLDWKGLLEMYKQIVQSGKETQFEPKARKREFSTSWLASWAAVHSVMGDVLEELLKGEERPIIDFSLYRNDILDIIDYLFLYPDPKREDETPDRGDLFTVAINSVRGKAFEALVAFIYQDGKQYPKEAKVKISADVKKVYERLLTQENALSVMFLFGHYLPSFMFRDEDWILSLIPKVFPEETEKKDLYLAAWEGYLANNLYKEIFEKFDFLYQRAINFDSAQYTDRKYFKEIDEGLAIHLALAYIHFPGFGLNNQLFVNFWKKENPKRHEAFIAFVGRHALSRESGQDKEVELKRLENLWDWVLENVTDNEALKGFGHWINPNKRVFENKWLVEHIRKTLEKTKGDIEWEYGLMHALPGLAKTEPQDSFKILKLYMLDAEKFGIQNHASIYVDSEILETLKILHANPDTKKQIYDLINELLLKGSQRFWKLKEVLGLETNSSL